MTMSNNLRNKKDATIRWWSSWSRPVPIMASCAPPPTQPSTISVESSSNRSNRRVCFCCRQGGGGGGGAGGGGIQRSFALMILVGGCLERISQRLDIPTTPGFLPIRLEEEADVERDHSQPTFRSVQDPITDGVSPHYKSSVLEQYILDHADDLGYHRPTGLSTGCDIWRNETLTDIYSDLQTFRNELRMYHHRLMMHPGIRHDLKQNLTSLFQQEGLSRQQKEQQQQDLCQAVEVHPDGFSSMFRQASLSQTQSAGFIEPLLPPLRHVDYCFKPSKRNMLSLQFLIHDFGHLCRSLKATSQKVFIDMGASLQFHSTGKAPAMDLIKLYHKFGFHFDHIYGYEITATDPNKVFSLIPKELRAAYHWINVGVSSEPDSLLNPLKMILDFYHPDDLIIVKLDVDTANVEVALAQQLRDPRFSSLVDAFYFEHHVRLRELIQYWHASVRGTVRDSLHLFRSLRENGIPAHSWV